MGTESHKTRDIRPNKRGPVERNPTETELIIDLANAWIPYGGPLAGQILEQFGMSEVRFYEKLSTIPYRGDLAASLRLRLRSAYPTSTPPNRGDRPPG